MQFCNGRLARWVWQVEAQGSQPKKDLPGPSRYSRFSAVLRVAVRGPLFAEVRQGEEQGLGARPGGHPSAGLSLPGAGRARVPCARGHTAAARGAPDGRQRRQDPARAWGRPRHGHLGGWGAGCAADAAGGGRGQGRGRGPDFGCSRATGQPEVRPSRFCRAARDRDPGVGGGEQRTERGGCRLLQGWCPPRTGAGVGRQGWKEGQGRGRTKPGARPDARRPCGGCASRVAGGGDRRGNRRGRRRGLEDFGKERPKVQHSDLHVLALEMLSWLLPEPQTRGEPGCGAPSTAARRDGDEAARGGDGGRGVPSSRAPREPLLLSPRGGSPPGARPRSAGPSPTRGAVPSLP